MLMRTDPFRELDRMTQQQAGTRAQLLAMPMDASDKVTSSSSSSTSRA